MSAILLVGCRSPETRATPTTTAPAVASSSAAPSPVVVQKKGPTKIDAFFEPMVEKLPPAATLSEQNGASSKCEKHGFVTYTLLFATSGKVPLASDEDLVDLVPWLRHKDPCLRQIALDAMVPKIGFDRNRLVIPSMHEPDHHLYHQLFVALKKHLDDRRVAYPATLFDGMMLDIREADFGPLLAGTWEEELNTHRNFRAFVSLEGGVLTVTSRTTSGDPKGTDYTQTSEVAAAKVNDLKQFEVTGAWRQESSSKGYVGAKVTPSDTTYRFWPVSRDEIWFDQGRTSWIKLVRPAKK